MVTRTVDLRSDTVTKPTETMWAAMATADIGDDFLCHDPTALRLETEMARITGKEAALFVPSGTMGNLISVLVHCDIRGSEVVLGNNSHIHIMENGGISTIGGVHPRTVKNNEDGTIDIDLIEAAIRDPRGALLYPITRLICLENTHANSGGKCLSVEYTDQVGELAKKHGLKLHIDGARIFNASVALGIPVHRLLQAADSASICLSKGLGAPVGSVIVGCNSFIAKAKILRKALGGGMRQIGILCAAAIVALQENVGKLEGDHKNAKVLAEGLNKIKGISVDAASVETNIFYFDIEESSKHTAESLSKYLQQRGVLVRLEGPSRVRIVLHHQISESDVQYTLSCFQKRARMGLWPQIEATIKLMDTAATELECFEALQKQEQLAASYRINGIREEVQKQKELERTLQGWYGDLVAELERVQSLVEKYRVQAQKEEEIAAKNRALELAEAEEGKTVVPSTETPVPIASDEQHGSSVPVGPSHDENEGPQMDASRSPKTDINVDIEKEHETLCIDTTVVQDNGPEGSDIKLSESERNPGGVLDTVVENDKMIMNSVDDAAGDSSTSTEVAKEAQDIEDHLNVVEAGKLDGVLTKQEVQVSEASGNDDFGSGDAMQVSCGK